MSLRVYAFGMERRSTGVVVGAIVSVLLVPFVPFSPLFGGAVTGAMAGEEGFRLGALCGLLSVVPLGVLLAAIVATVAWIGILGSLTLFAVGWLVGVGFIAVVLYATILSAIGGAAGAALRQRAVLTARGARCRS